MTFALMKDCKPFPNNNRVFNPSSGFLVGTYASEEDALRAAQSAGMMVPAGEDEGGPEYGVLADGVVITQR